MANLHFRIECLLLVPLFERTHISVNFMMSYLNNEDYHTFLLLLLLWLVRYQRIELCTNNKLYYYFLNHPHWELWAVAANCWSSWWRDGAVMVTSMRGALTGNNISSVTQDQMLLGRRRLCSTRGNRELLKKFLLTVNYPLALGCDILSYII